MSTETDHGSARGGELLVRDLMTERVFSVLANDDVATVRDLMVDHNVRHVPVVDEEQNLVGIVSQRDLLRAALFQQAEVPPVVERTLLERVTVLEIMTTGPDFVSPEATLQEAAACLLDAKYGSLPVVVGQRLVGILTEADFVRLAAERVN